MKFNFQNSGDRWSYDQLLQSPHFQMNNQVQRSYVIFLELQRAEWQTQTKRDQVFRFSICDSFNCTNLLRQLEQDGIKNGRCGKTEWTEFKDQNN